MYLTLAPQWLSSSISSSSVMSVFCVALQAMSFLYQVEDCLVAWSAPERWKEGSAAAVNMEQSKAERKAERILKAVRKADLARTREYANAKQRAEKEAKKREKEQQKAEREFQGAAQNAANEMLK